MRKLATTALLFALLSSASLASAQTVTTQNPYAWSPMFSFWGTQATTPTIGTTTTHAQATATTNTSALQELWSLMPMFSFFNFSR
ncbi:hypothetical protein [Fundidesulfovibrio terrae]|uniref:hypothetical protein n=1 Tax=Fundidesulfovibrio terrae TaxID=2922866 RepID=UPI001FB04806|nr:hypothetical protein [Fundidesulfovibrio terrae]